LKKWDCHNADKERKISVNRIASSLPPLYLHYKWGSKSSLAESLSIISTLCISSRISWLRKPLDGKGSHVLLSKRIGLSSDGRWQCVTYDTDAVIGTSLMADASHFQSRFPISNWKNSFPLAGILWLLLLTLPFPSLSVQQTLAFWNKLDSVVQDQISLTMSPIFKT
jgi:hypothetical protein